MNSEIQALRAIAIVFVLFIHSVIIFPPEYLYIYKYIISVFRTDAGVELFFVIAGYFLAQSCVKFDLLEKVNDRVKSAATLIVKKIKRLSPVAYLWALIPLTISIISGDHSWLASDVMIKKFFASIVWLRNFEESNKQTIFGYYWAISLEMQVFVVYPILYAFLGKKRTLGFSVLACIAMAFFRYDFGMGWMFRFDSILWGVLTYHLINEYIDINYLRDLIKPYKKHKSIIALLLILSLPASMSFVGHIPSLRFTIAALISVVILCLSLTQLNFFSFKFPPFNKIIQFVGDRSYSVFCCHIPSWMIVSLLFDKFGASHGYLFITQILFMVICADLTHRFVEKR